MKDQIAERLKAHNMSNLSRKLTPAERRAKKTKKLLEDTSIIVHVRRLNVSGRLNTLSTHLYIE